MAGHVRGSVTSVMSGLARFRVQVAEFNLLRVSGSTGCDMLVNHTCVPTGRLHSFRAYASAAPTDDSSEPLHGLNWPPRPEALAANPILAHALRSAARHSRSELHERVNILLNRHVRHWLSHTDMHSLLDEDVAEELQQCDMPISDSRAQNLATLYGIIKQHQPSSPPQQQVRLDERAAAQPAGRDTAQTGNIEPERLPYATIATPAEIANMLVAAKADDVCILDVSSQCSFTEHMVLATGRSHRHIQAAAAAVAYQMSLRCSEVAPGAHPSVEGEDGSDWCVVDAGSIIVHVFSEEARGIYDLDGLWSTGRNYTKVDSGSETLESMAKPELLEAVTSYA